MATPTTNRNPKVVEKSEVNKDGTSQLSIPRAFLWAVLAAALAYLYTTSSSPSPTSPNNVKSPAPSVSASRDATPSIKTAVTPSPSIIADSATATSSSHNDHDTGTVQVTKTSDKIALPEATEANSAHAESDGPKEKLALNPATYASSEDYVVIEDTTHCTDLHHHIESNTLFTACLDSTETRFVWNPLLKRYEDPGAPARVIGSLHSIDISTMKSKRLEFDGYSGQFVNYGIDVIDDPKQKGAVYIFAVNHHPNAKWAQWMQEPELKEDSEKLHKSQRHIEIFHHVLGTNTVRPVRSVRDDMILMPTDIHAISPESFYVTSDPILMGSATMKVGDTAQAAKSSVFHVQISNLWEAWDPEMAINITVASTTLQNNDAIGHGQQEQEVLLTSMTAGTLMRGRRSGVDNKRITYVDEVKVGSMLGAPTYFKDRYSKVEGDASGYILPTQYRALERSLGLDKDVHDDTIKIWHARRAKKGSSSSSWVRSGNWEKRLLFEDNGERIQSASSAVLVGIDPKTEDDMKKGWLFITGMVSKNMVAVKVDL